MKTRNEREFLLRTFLPARGRALVLDSLRSTMEMVREQTGCEPLSIFALLAGADAAEDMNAYRRLLRENPQYAEEGEEILIDRFFAALPVGPADGEGYDGLYAASLEKLADQCLEHVAESAGTKQGDEHGAD